MCCHMHAQSAAGSVSGEGVDIMSDDMSQMMEDDDDEDEFRDDAVIPPRLRLLKILSAPSKKKV